MHNIGEYELDRVHQGDCMKLIPELPNESLDVVITSPPYWGQRLSSGIGVEEDPRDYLRLLIETFNSILPKLKDEGILWINLGDSYNTPINWRYNDHVYSSLGADGNGLKKTNSAYTKPRARRKTFIDKSVKWLQYGNLLGLPYRLVLGLCDVGFIFRGEVIWSKNNPMPEGRCRRPHRCHEPIYLFSKNERHQFRTQPGVKSVWNFSNEKIKGKAHYSRYPEELPRRCIQAYGKTGKDIIVFDPFSGSGTTGLAALKMDCSYIGFEIEQEHVVESNSRLNKLTLNPEESISK